MSRRAPTATVTALSSLPVLPSPSPSPAPPTERVLSILGLLIAEPEREVTLSEIADELELSISTCHAITTVLVARRYLLRAPAGKTFTLGPALLTAGRAAELAVPAARLARERLADLAAKHAVEAVASVVADGVITVVEWIAPPHGAAAAYLGQRVPFSPPFGAVHAAWSPAHVVDAWLSRAPTSAHAQLHDLLGMIRARGFDVHRDDANSARVRDALSGIEHERLSDAARDALAILNAELAGVDQLPLRFDGRRRYVVNTISGVVRSASGHPVLTLSLLFHRSLSGAEIEAAGAALLAL